MEEERERRRAQDWLFEELRTLRQEHKDAHQRLRMDMNEGFDRLRFDVISKQTERLDNHSTRLTVIEKLRESEERHAARAGRIAAVLSTLGLTALLELIRSLSK